LQCQHSKVVALFGVAYEAGHSLGRLCNECVRLGRCGLQHFLDPLLAKHLALGILGLVESVGIEEEGGALILTAYYFFSAFLLLILFSYSK
jgi:hypothetical protein